MPRLDHRTLINMGRKAGLKTWELYTALSARRLSAAESAASGRDGNGFRAGLDATGHPVYQPPPADQSA